MNEPVAKPETVSRYLDGAKLRQRRLAAGLTQSELAARVRGITGTNIRRPDVSRHENGPKGCNMTVLRAYADATDCGPGDLMRSEVIGHNEAAAA